MRESSQEPATCHAAIIAGGQSRRFGRPKALIDVNGEPLIHRVATTLRSAFTDVVAITSSPEIAAAADCEMIPDIIPGHGPLSGIHAALTHFAGPVVCVACDMPNLNAGFLARIAELLGSHDAAVPTCQGFLQPLHAVYAPSCLPAFETELQQERVRPFRAILSSLDLLEVGEGEALAFDRELRMFHNWNTPDDMTPATGGGQ